MLMFFCWYAQIEETGAELERLGAENKELCLLLHMMNEKYTALRAHVEKMREEMNSVNESCWSHDLINRPPIEITKPQSTCILVKSKEDNTSLVSLLTQVLSRSD